MNRETIVGRVPSLSDPLVLYEITSRVAAGPGAVEELSCDCQAFYSWKKRGLPCWHLRVWDSAQKSLARCYELHGGTGDDNQTLCVRCLLTLIAAMTARVKKEYVLAADAKERVAKARAAKSKKPRTKRAKTETKA